MEKKRNIELVTKMKFGNKTIAIMLILLVVLNIIDALATVYFVSNGYAEELNPLMAAWLELGNIPFLFVKLFFTSLGIGFLWYSRKHKLAHILTAILLVVYIVIATVHINIANIIWTIM